MTDAAFRATFANARPVLGRGVVQFIFEVPVELATAALTALGGYPAPGDAPWCAIVRLNIAPVAQRKERPTPNGQVAGSNPAGRANSDPERSARPADSAAAVTPAPDADVFPPVSGKPAGAAPAPLTKRAHTMCEDTSFTLWASNTFHDNFAQFRNAKAWLRDYCGVESFRELATNEDAREQFLLVEARYNSRNLPGDPA